MESKFENSIKINEQSRFEARQFCPNLTFEVYASDVYGGERLGVVGLGDCLEVPSCDYWWVEQVGEVSVRAVVDEVKAHEIPGVRASNWSNDEFELLREIPDLRYLYLEGSNIDDDGLDHVVQLTQLEYLDLESTRITNDGVKKLKFLTELDVLCIGIMDSVTGACLADVVEIESLKGLNLVAMEGVGNKELLLIKRLEHLEYLDIAEINLCDSDLAGISDFVSLKVLNLSHMIETYTHSDSRITCIGLAYLKDLINLEILHLACTNVGDDGVKHFKNFNKLKVLNLACTKITDAGLVNLYVLKNLAYLNLRLTKVSRAGVTLLQEALPRCKIVTKFQ